MTARRDLRAISNELPIVTTRYETRLDILERNEFIEVHCDDDNVRNVIGRLRRRAASFCTSEIADEPRTELPRGNENVIAIGFEQGQRFEFARAIDVEKSHGKFSC